MNYKGTQSADGLGKYQRIDVEGNNPRFSGHNQWRGFVFAFNSLALVVNLCFFALFGLWQQEKLCTVQGRRAPPTPAKNIIDYQLHTFQLESVYSGTPNANLDRAWDALLFDEVSPFGVSVELFQRLNPSLETGVKIPNDSEGRYMATFDVVHQLHCVNLLRQSLYAEDYQQYDAFHGPPGHLQGHLGHCLEQLRQSIMCNGDTSVLTYNWVRGEALPKPNFRSVHSCQNWDRIREWSHQHDISSQIKNLSRPIDGPELLHVICEEGVDCPKGAYS